MRSTNDTLTNTGKKKENINFGKELIYDKKRIVSSFEDNVTNEDDNIRHLKIQKLDKNISFKFESQSNLSQEKVVSLQTEPFQIVRDCFAEGTAPNFHFSKKVVENNYVRSCKWFILLFY